MSTHVSPIRRFFSDSQGNLVVGQIPNAPLLAWLIATVLIHFVHEGSWLTFLQIVAKAGLIIWALLEIYSGSSPFRRVLGLIVIVFSIVSLL